ncbi:MAG TPA: hypothetical protein VF328_11165 [Mycobacterium sp.]
MSDLSLVNNIKGTITEPERDAVIAQFAARLASTGPFREMKVVTADPSRDAADVLATAGIDNAHVNRLVVLDPTQQNLIPAVRA